MSVKERLIEYIFFKKISKRSFSLSIGMSENYVTSMRNSIQPGTLTKISEKYPDLNIGWLITGEGDMLRRGYSENKYDADMISDKALEFLKSKIDNVDSKTLDSVNIGDLLILKLHNRIVELEKKIENLENKIDTIKKGR